MNASSFAEEVLGRLRESLARTPYRELTFESITLQDSDGDFNLVALFRHINYPGCLFGYRWGPVYAYALRDARAGGQREVSREQAEHVFAIFLTNLEEEVYAGNGDLPKDCEPDTVTWINPRPHAPNSP